MIIFLKTNKPNNQEAVFCESKGKCGWQANSSTPMITAFSCMEIFIIFFPFGGIGSSFQSALIELQPMHILRTLLCYILHTHNLILDAFWKVFSHTNLDKCSADKCLIFINSLSLSLVEVSIFSHCTSYLNTALLLTLVRSERRIWQKSIVFILMQPSIIICSFLSKVGSLTETN